MKISLPAFENLTAHVTDFGKKYTIVEMWEIYDRLKADTVTDRYYETKIDHWKTILIGVTESVLKKAKDEMEQILFIGSPIAQKHLVAIVKDNREIVNRNLSKDAICSVIDEYNKHPEPLYIKEDGDTNEENWSVGMKKNILDTAHLDNYYDKIMQGFLLKKFNNLCDEIISTYELGLRSNTLFPEKKEVVKRTKEFNFVDGICDAARLKKVIDELVKREYLKVDKITLEYKWLGIGTNKVGSLAALANHLQEAGIMRLFGTPTDAARVYFKHFNPLRTSVKEFLNHYELNKTGGSFLTEFAFILEVK